MRNLHLTFDLCTVVKSKVKITQNFVAFSEYMNFIINEFQTALLWLIVCKLYSENLHFCLNYIRKPYLTLNTFLESLCENRRQGCWIKRDKLQLYINLFWDNVYSLYPRSLNLISYVTHVMINYSCSKITTTWIKISHQNWNVFFSNASR